MMLNIVNKKQDFLNKKKIIDIFLCYKRNKTLQNMQLWENNQLQVANSNAVSTSEAITLHVGLDLFVDYFPITIAHP